MAYLAVFQPDQRDAVRLARALKPIHDVEVHPSWDALDESLTRRKADGCVVDADHPSRRIALARIRRLRRRHPGMALVACTHPDRRRDETFHMAKLGVDGVIRVTDLSNGRGCRNAVDHALAHARSLMVRRALEGRFDEEAAHVVAWAVDHAREAPTVAVFARALGRSPKDLRAYLRSLDLPTSGRLLMWGRLILAGAYLGRDGRTAQETAYALGYSTANALSRAMKRETGLRLTDVARDGLPGVMEALFPEGGGRDGARLSAGCALLAAFSLATAGCAGGPAAPAAGPVPAGVPGVERVIATPPIDQLHVGVLAVDAGTGDTVYAHNAHRKFIPASNQKILVTAAALSLLGPDHRWETSLWAGEPVRDGLLDGDLLVDGTGDPTLSDRFADSGFGDDPLAELAHGLRSAGVSRVTGDLVVDVARWDSTSIGPTWEVADLPWRYAATGGAFAVDEGELRVVVRGGMHEGDPAVASLEREGRDDFVDARLVTGPDSADTRVRASYLPESHRVVLTGTVAPGAVDSLSFAVRDPVRHGGWALHRALRRAGVAVDGGVRVAWDSTAVVLGTCRAGAVPACGGARRLAARQSPPLSLVVQGILEPSQNWMTEQLLRTLGAELGEGGSWSAGLDVMTEFLTATVGVDSLDVAPRDGSGLSSYNLVTPRAIVAVLRHMRAGPHGSLYRDAMAEPQEEDSTLERRLDGLQGRLWAKTGTISNVNSLSGYLVGDDGRDVVFSILTNGSGLPSSTVRAAIDDIARALAAR